MIICGFPGVGKSTICGADMRREDNGRDEENHNRV